MGSVGCVLRRLEVADQVEDTSQLTKLLSQVLATERDTFSVFCCRAGVDEDMKQMLDNRLLNVFQALSLFLCMVGLARLSYGSFPK